jgi:hypothetical protein
VQQVLDRDASAAPTVLSLAMDSTPRTGGRMCREDRRRRLEIWADFIEGELAARNMRPAQLALYANVNASTVSVWRHRKSLPDREAVQAVARCFRMPVELVAEKAGMLPPPSQRQLSRLETDAEWRALVADLDRLPSDVFNTVKGALRLALRSQRQRRAG